MFGGVDFDRDISLIPCSGAVAISPRLASPAAPLLDMFGHISSQIPPYTLLS